MNNFVSAYRPRPFEATFGYFNTAYIREENVKKTHRIINLMNALGYVPILGTIIGIARIVFFQKPNADGESYSRKEKSFSRFQIARGCIETLSIGIILIIPDIIFSINRALESEVADKDWWANSFSKFKDNRE